MGADLSITNAEHAVQPLWARAITIAVAALCYFALARGSLYFASINASVTPVWPPTGLALALVLIRGPSMLPAVFVGALAANFAITPSLMTSAAIAMGNTLEALIAVMLLRRWADGERVFHSPLGVVRFACIVIVAAAPASATLGVTALAATGFASWDDFVAIWVTWWLGDLAGAILAAPALVLWMRTWRGADAADFSLELLAPLLAGALIGVLAFSPLSPVPASARGALAFLTILPLLWAAINLGLRDTATTALVISSFAVWGTIAGSSPFAQDRLNDSLLLLVAFIVTATLPSLALAADRRATRTALNKSREELVQAQKLEALGQLTGGVAHDFNNLLAAMRAGMRALQKQEQERVKTLELMDQTLERGATLSKQLLAFARREPLRPEITDLNAVMNGIEALIRQSLNEAITLEIRTGAGLWPVKIERNQFELAVLNLAVNARDAMPEGGMLTIETQNVATANRQSVTISVIDTGVGMSPEVMARAFEPFFSTKAAGAGTGLGLAQVYSFAKESGGVASIESTPGAGTTVTITLPRA